MADLHLERDRHARYWQRCLKTLLPSQYTSTDSNRMLLGFFILSALDLLGDSLDTLPEPERANIREWVLKCQHPNGGFCGSPNHRYPDEYYVDGGHGKSLMDPANLPATYFAILSLSYVGGLDKIKKQDCMRWLKTLQREDGSFGELLTEDGTLEGGRDMRYCYVAAAIRWILSGDQEDLEDIDVERLVDHLRNGQVWRAFFKKLAANTCRHMMAEFRNRQNMRHMVSTFLSKSQNNFHLLDSRVYVLCHRISRLPQSTSWLFVSFSNVTQGIREACLTYTCANKSACYNQMVSIKTS